MKSKKAGDRSLGILRVWEFTFYFDYFRKVMGSFRKGSDRKSSTCNKDHVATM